MIVIVGKISVAMTLHCLCVCHNKTKTHLALGNSATPADGAALIAFDAAGAAPKTPSACTGVLLATLDSEATRLWAVIAVGVGGGGSGAAAGCGVVVGVTVAVSVAVSVDRVWGQSRRDGHAASQGGHGEGPVVPGHGGLGVGVVARVRVDERRGRGVRVRVRVRVRVTGSAIVVSARYVS